MNMRELPLFLKRCLIYDTISREFEIPVDVSEKILRHLSSREQKHSHLVITELKGAIEKYHRGEYIKFKKDLSVFYDDTFYDRVSRGYGECRGYGQPIPQKEIDHWNNAFGYDCPREFCESFLPCDPSIEQTGMPTCCPLKLYDFALGTPLGAERLKSDRTTYNMNLNRFMSLSKCHLHLSNMQMKTAAATAAVPVPSCSQLPVSEFYEYVDPPIRASYARMSLAQRREQFYQYSEKQVEEEAEYYIYLIKSSLSKELPLREIHPEPPIVSSYGSLAPPPITFSNLITMLAGCIFPWAG